MADVRKLVLSAMLAGAFLATAAAGDDTLPADVAAKPWTGDLDGMTERRLIRALVPYSKTLYFVDRGTQRTAGGVFGFPARADLGEAPHDVV